MKKYFVVLLLLLLCGLCTARTTLPDPNYEGFFDVGDCNVIAGWAADLNRPNTSINVSVYDGTTLLTTVLAKLSRPDVAGVIGDNGLHGFNMPLPAGLRDGLAHSISVRFESTSVELSNSPRSIGPCVTPRGNVGTGVLLNVDFKLNNGAASTTQRVVSLNVKATQVTGATREDLTSKITDYRVLEEPDSRNLVTDLSAQPWIPFTHDPKLELAERNAERQRYGERRVALQVKIATAKTATLTSDVVSDTIVLDPVLKEYRVNGITLVKFAADQGFKFPLIHYHTCNGDCQLNNFTADHSLASGTAAIGVQTFIQEPAGTHKIPMVCVLVSLATLGIAAPLVCDPAPPAAGTCTTEADYLLFDGRSPNQFWRIKSVNVPGVVSDGANRFRAKFTRENPAGVACNAPFRSSISVGDVVVEGPEVDDFTDPANQWKDAFVRLRRPTATVKPGLP